jgi:serine protease AprX
MTAAGAGDALDEKGLFVRRNLGLRDDGRHSALWGRGGDNRGNALWGRSKRGILVTATALTLIIPVVGNAAGSSANHRQAGDATAKSTLLHAAAANPDQVFDVIVQTRGTAGKGRAAEAVAAARTRHPGKAHGAVKRFAVINGAAAQLTGAQILDLASRKDVVAITEDVPMVSSGSGTTSTSTTCTNCPFEGVYWPYVTGVTGFWPKSGRKATPPPQAPAIAIVDSGIDSSNTLFGGRVVKQLTLTSLTPNATGDGRGHGTFVAGIASGMINNWGGASPTSNLVSLDVMNDKGKAMTSDVIAAADWIYQHKDEYGIRVANFSLHAEGESSFLVDPLDKAIERLWFSGVVVVTAAGNYAENGQASGVPYAPANDPFVITVGSVDVNGTTDLSDDFASPWSAYGYTLDGFSKPELGAPGRYMIGAVPPTATMTSERPDRVIAPGFMRLSGTSFAAPVVAGAAADLLALHPRWTPDDVKGALMASAKALPAASPGSLGVGEAKLDAAALVSAPPNPNLALDRFLAPDPLGGSTPIFDAASWVEAARNDAAWDSASWPAVSWGDSSWASISWSDVSWATVSWGDVAWGDVSWGDISWSDGESAKHAWPDLVWLD